MATRRKKKRSRRASKKRGRRTSKKRRTAKRAAKRTHPLKGYKGPLRIGPQKRKKKGKGQVPLQILEERLGKLSRIVKKRGGKMPRL